MSKKTKNKKKNEQNMNEETIRQEEPVNNGSSLDKEVPETPAEKEVSDVSTDKEAPDVSEAAAENRPKSPVTAQRTKNNYKIYLVAALKLLCNGLIIFLCYDRLKSYHVYDDIMQVYDPVNRVFSRLFHKDLTYQLFGIAGAGVSALLYLLVLSQVKIKDRVGYTLFALLFWFDSIFLLFPCKELVMVLFCLLLVICIRIQSPLRYMLGVLLLAGGSVLITPYLVLLLPLYVVVRIWQKNDLWGIRVILLFLLLFAFLYQYGILDFLPNVRPDSLASTALKPIFAPEDLIGHVAYYLPNYLLTMLRILLPFEVLVRGDLHTFVFLPVQLAAFFGYLVIFRYLLHIDWSKKVCHEDRMTADALFFVLGLIAVMTITVPDLGQAFRELMPLYPLYLFLFFGTEKHLRHDLADRSFQNVRPVVFFHKGADGYVRTVIDQANKQCGSDKVILLGDESNQDMCSNWYNAADYDNKELKQFRELYEHHCEDHSYDFEFSCFERHFVLYEFMRRMNISECIACDSDVLLYDDLSTMPLTDIDFACTSAMYPVCLGECASPHCTYWKIDLLHQFLEFILHVYRSKTDWLVDVSKRQKESECYPSGDITDMILLTAWRKIVDDYDASFRFRNFDQCTDGVVFDHNLASADNLVMDEYLYSKALGRKCVQFQKQVPMFTAKDGTRVRAAILHCSGRKEAIPYLAKHSNLSPLYWLAKVLD